MDIKYKTCDIRTREKHLFLDISSTNIDTLVPSLYHCVENGIIVVLFFPQPLPHLRSTSSSLAKRLAQRWVLADQTDGSHYGPRPSCMEVFQDVPTVVPIFSPGLLGLYGVWHCHDETVPLVSWPGRFLRIASRSFNRTSQYDVEFTFSPRFWKWATSTT
jgi:hypothetical protein